MKKDYFTIMKELREDNDLTQKEVAAILGIRQQAYSRYESGKRGLPIHHLLTLVKYYKVSADYFLGLRDKM